MALETTEKTLDTTVMTVDFTAKEIINALIKKKEVTKVKTIDTFVIKMDIKVKTLDTKVKMV